MNLASVEQAAKKNVEREDQVRQILLEAYGFQADAPDNDKLNGTRLLAAECGARLFNVLYTVRNPRELTGYGAIMDLTVNLNNNAFWLQHGTVLMPLLHMALCAQADYAMLLVEKDAKPTYTADDEVRAECRLVGLELFSMIAFIVGGQMLVMQCSLPLKRQLSILLG